MDETLATSCKPGAQHYTNPFGICNFLVQPTRSRSSAHSSTTPPWQQQGLVVDQTIEKVSFCAPDRNHERGFSYICRDGTTRRWMCHGFGAKCDSGERLSHAVGCAFAVCLERKQRRDKDAPTAPHGVTMNFDNKTSTFTRCGSFRQSSITDRIQDPQLVKPSGTSREKRITTSPPEAI